MISSSKNLGTDIRALLSTLWIFVLFNMLFRDLHDFVRPGLLEEMMAGVVNGTKITDELLLVGGIMVEIPIAMVLLSRILKYGLNRWANMIAGAMVIASVISFGTKDLDDVFFATIEIIALSVIILCAWKWRK